MAHCSDSGVSAASDFVLRSLYVYVFVFLDYFQICVIVTYQEKDLQNKLHQFERANGECRWHSETQLFNYFTHSSLTDSIQNSVSKSESKTAILPFNYIYLNFSMSNDKSSELLSRFQSLQVFPSIVACIIYDCLSYTFTSTLLTFEFEVLV
ncbi:Hypothetical_protein [Hexamita inflata]|uniref:Hypothetical_protein n=1 Tax=Hexamita inflata TaxID=28002 RepID=A0AA86Q7K5_9EUKA|nr:Hypothetical protein HINF_LOCUS41554 [Hexamita inflata]